MFSSSLHKAVILSEAPRRSIAYRTVYRAKSKDPGDACWKMLFGAFRPQTGKLKVTSSERSRATVCGSLYRQPIRDGSATLSFVIPTGANPNFLPRGTGQGRVCAF